MNRHLAIAVFVCHFGSALAQSADTDAALKHSEAQLGSSVGLWDVTTQFLNEDGTVAKSVQGTYEFAWVVPGRVVSGTSRIPELKQASGILFYINVSQKKIEMVPVGDDGNL